MVRYFSPANCLHTQNTRLKCYNSELVTEFPMLACLCFREKPEEIIVRPLMGNGASSSGVKRKRVPTLYIYGLSAPARAAWMTAKAAEIPVRLKYIDLFKGEHKTPEFAKINPDMTVPTLVDGDFTLWESRPIMQYMVSKWGGKHSYLYPTDLQKRAICDRLMNFDLGSVYKTVTEFTYPQLFQGKPPDPDKEAAMKKAFEYLNRNLDGGQRYMTGDDLTIVDISMATNISLTEIKGYMMDKWPDLAMWYRRMKALPYWAECNKGLYEWKTPQ